MEIDESDLKTDKKSALFGGALTCCLPVLRNDVSDLREIPDNQEVFVHPKTDQSLIIEIIEFQQAEDDRQAASIYFQDLAESNSAEIVKMNTAEDISKSNLSMLQCSKCIMTTGQQSISKFKDKAQNLVEIHVGMLRLPQFTTDIVVTMNDPLVISEASSSKGAETSNSPGAWTKQTFLDAVQSMTLEDPGIFGS